MFKHVQKIKRGINVIIHYTNQIFKKSTYGSTFYVPTIHKTQKAEANCESLLLFTMSISN